MIQVNEKRAKLDAFSVSSDSKVFLSLLSNLIYFWLFCDEYLVKRQDKDGCESNGVRVRVMRKFSD
jgi:hypothetical protein